MDVCERFSARLTRYETKEEFDDIVHYLSKGNIKKTETCWTWPDDTTRELSTWLALTNAQKEGVWISSDTNKQVEYLPWGPNLPMASKKYNCLGLKVTLRNNMQAFHGDMGSALVEDYQCNTYPVCPLCTSK